MAMNTSRIIQKAILYRIFSVIVTFCVSYFFVRNATDSILISIMTESIQFVIYCLYEMCWNEYFMEIQKK